MTFTDLVVGLRLNIANFTTAMNNVRMQTQRLNSQFALLSRNGAAEAMISGYESLNSRLHTVGLSLKDISRIASGIMISQTFYGITRSIREATSALWEFNESIDYAQVTYGALFGSADISADFIDTLKQFSVDTIFEYTDIEGMARKLSAYGIEYKNLMYIIEGLTNLGTISGDSAALERLAVAIGQINAKGTLKAEEMRQLANAYVPIYDILREKLHLTEEDLKRVGDLGIKSADAINAIIEYANETFGGTAEAAIFTITGLNNRIVDTLKVMGASIITPITTFYKSLAKYIADSLGQIHEIYKQSGLGGVFEYLVPSEEWQNRIRSFIASIKNAVYVAAAHLMTMWPYIKQFFGGLMDAFTLFLGVLNSASTALVAFLQYLSDNTNVLRVLTSALVAAAGGWLLFKIQALGAAVISVLKVIIVDVAKAVVFLTTVLTRHPLVAGLVILGAVLLGVASNARNTKSAISDLVNAFNSFSIGGNTADDVLQVGGALNDSTVDSEQFWDSMEGGAADAEDAMNGAGNAAKKAQKNLLSFDEVFRLNDGSSTAGIGSGALDGIGNLSDALSGLGSALIPEIPDLSSFATDFVGTLYDELWEALKTITGGAAVGTLIGGLVGFAIGGLVTKTMGGALTGAKYGAAIGALAGAGLAGFWTDTYEELKDSLERIAIGTAVGTLTGGLIGMVIGAFATKTVDGALTGAKYGAAIGTLVGAGLGTFWASMSAEMSNTIERVVVGGATGALLGGIAGLVIGAFATKSLKGAVTGAKIGSTIGTVLGATFETIFKDAEDGLGKSLGNMFSSVAAASYAMFAGALVGMILGAVVGAAAGGIGAIPGAKAGAMIGAAVGGLVNLIATWLNSSGIAEAIGGWFSNLFGNIGQFFSNLGTTIGNWFVEKWEKLTGWFTKIGEKIGTWLSEVWASISGWFSDLGSDIVSWWNGLWDKEKWATGWSKVSGWFSSMWDEISTWFTNTGAKIITAWNNLWDKDKWASGWSKVKGWFSDLWISIKNWFDSIVSKVSTVWNALWNKDNWVSGWKKVTGWFSDLWTDIKEWFTELKSDVKGWWNDLWDLDTKTIVGALGGGGLKTAVSSVMQTRIGHAKGGIFNREHIARFAEGNKAEAVIPLEDQSAMQPFVNAISDGILQGLLPAMAVSSGSSDLPPMYIGTLIADERGLEQLYKKFELYEAKELARKGMA